MSPNENTPPWSQPITVAELPAQRDTAFSVVPDSTLLKTLKDELGLQNLRKLRFKGTLTPNGRTDWRLDGELGATVVQNCVITLKPVTTRIDENVSRLFIGKMPEIEEGSEVEITNNENTEQLGEIIDPGEIMVEALTLVLPEFPKIEDAELGQTFFTEPGKTPMDDAEARPFSGLKAMREKLENGGD